MYAKVATSYVPGAHEQAVTDDLGLGGGVAQGLAEEFG